MMIRHAITFCLLTATLLTLASCTMVDRAVRSIPVPSLSDVTSVIPGLGKGVQDPEVPFDPYGTLQPGHTVRLKVFDGARSAKQLYTGTVVIDDAGMANFGDAGAVKLGGKSINEGRQMIASAFRRAGKAASHVNVHLYSVEGMDLITVEGDVARPTVLPLKLARNVSTAVSLAGGRRAGFSGYVYVARDGQRAFFMNEQKADAAGKLHAGDIITLSPPL